MRKRFFTLILILLIGFAIFISGCGKKESPKEEKPAVEEKEGHEKEEPGVVILSEEKQKGAGIETVKISPESISVPISATAVIELNADRVSKISPMTSGRIVKLTASLSDRVKAGQPLAYFDSPELGQIWAEYLKAKGRVELTRKNLKREETLFEKKVSPEKDVLRARQELSEAEADLNLSRERFRLLGIDISQMELQRNGKGNDHPLIPISSALSGAVIEKNVSQGEVVGSEKALFTVADLSTLWVVIDIYEKDISRLKTGIGVKVSVTAFPDRDFRGRISYIGDVVDEKTRTVKARVTVDNSGGLLKPGMFATVSIDAKGVTEKAIALPEEAVLIDGIKRYVFVQISPDKFKRNDITAGRTFGKRVEVTEGLKEGDNVAIKGVFILKSELKKEFLKAE